MQAPLVLAASLLAILGGCSDGCANDVVSRATSPDGKVSAVIFERNCGATTGYSTQISLIGPDKEPSGPGNLFRADTGHGAARSGAWGGPWAELRWLSPNHLLVRYATGARIFEQSARVGGVDVTYEAAP
ncbi:hypothetical protein QO010_000666 [Caulobacter ginsengisoli]|uniref:Lipoprotein n=1 Tax=Caulobacter ginsengisoli TaxID=400775 RepID=A0ABU0ILM3_9CAUL|nr:hypothetical protein [Caulobacter ginsengisoli]MDQ0462918.1 hypothetical protein [Caulobacter ginsengisoli]